MRAVRVGFSPTSSISTREPGRAAAATIQKAAEEKSPGTDSCCARALLPAVQGHGAALHADLEAEGRQRPLGVVPRLRGLEDRRVAFGMEPGKQDGALDLGARYG